jgi:hypothetical protein
MVAWQGGLTCEALTTRDPCPHQTTAKRLTVLLVFVGNEVGQVGARVEETPIDIFGKTTLASFDLVCPVNYVFVVKHAQS